LFWYFVFSSVSAIWYQLLQSGIYVLSLQLFWYFVFSSVSAIWYFCSVSAIVLVFLLFSFCNLVFELSFWKKKEWYFVFCFCKIWYFDFPSTSAIWYFCSISVIVLVFLLLFSFCNLVFAFSFCKKKKLEWYFFSLLQNLVFRLSFSFCNLIFLSVSAIVLVFHLLFSFCNLVSASAIWYFCPVSAIVLVFCLLFSFYNLVFELSFCKKILEWYFIFRFCKIWYFDFPSASVMAFTTKEIVWLRWLLADMRVFFSHPTPMNYDNQSSIQIIHNSVFMSELSTLRSIVILLIIISSMAPLLCLLFILPCRLQISLPRRIPYLVFVF